MNVIATIERNEFLMKKILISGLALLVAACSLFFVACSNGNSQKNNDSIDLIFVCPIQNNVYWQDCMRGIEVADAELGTKTKVIGPQEADHFTTEIVEYMKEAVDENPNGIMLYAGVEGLWSYIDDAVEHGIPVVAIDSDAPDTLRLAYVGIDSYNAGYKGGEALRDIINDSGKVGVLVSSLDSEHEMKVIDAFNDCIADFDITVVDTQEAGAITDVAAEKTKQMLAEHPEINAIFATAGYNVAGAAQAAKELGRQDLAIVGFDDIEENLQYLREGYINALIVQSPYDMGYTGVYVLKEAVENGRTTKKFYDTGISLITIDNVDSYKS